MKKLLTIGLLIFTLSAQAQKWGALTNVSTLLSNYLFVIAVPGSTNYSISYGQLTNLFYSVFDQINSAVNSTNTSRLAINLTSTFDALGAAVSSTNTTRLAANLAATFDALNAALNATNTANLTINLSPSWSTNTITTQSANYAILNTDNLILLTGAHTTTLPTAVGIPGKLFTIKCSSAGTNAILTTSSQTIDGAAKWTNTATLKYTTVISDGANWRVVGQN